MSGYDRREAVRKGRVLLGTRVNHWAVLVAAVTALVTSALWYVVFGNAWLTLRGIDPSTAEGTPPLWQMTGQFARNLVVATVLAHLLRWLEVTTWRHALQVGLLVWFGFEAMAVVGSVLHENYPLDLYLIHVGDALQATLLMAFILGAWRRGGRRDVEISPSVSTSS
jgi:hypothetical protein